MRSILILITNIILKKEREIHMKHMKKIWALLFAVIMMLAIGTTAMAYTVIINQNSADKGTHTYGAYQIFKGTLSSDGVLSNIEWGSGITEAGKTALGDAAAYAEAITNDTAAKTKAAELAQYLANPEKTGSDKIEGLEGGYYLIQDTVDPTGSLPSSKTKFILKVVKDTSVTVKSSVPSVEKKVQDINDSDAAPTLSGLQDSADYDIGDSIPYTITATIGDGIGYYDSYSLQFVDTMSKGLTLDEGSWDIKVGTKSIKSSFALTSAAGANGGTIWTWAAQNIKDEVSANSKVVLTYNATLNKDAVVGSAGNPNTVVLKYDNNPNASGNGTPGGTTPPDTNIVFTYKVVFNKVDADQKALTGADFKLEKKVNGAWTDVTTLGSGENKPTKAKDSLTSGGATAANAKFTFSGLDDGEYKLTETTTPSGYNTIDPIVFTITAEHDILSDSPVLKSLNGTDGSEFTMTSSEGTLTANVVNKKGSTLPETGGIGTTIFYVLGSILVLGAVILLVTRRRMSR